MAIHHISQETIFFRCFTFIGSSLCYFQWFEDNETKANVDKCHVLLSTSNELTVKINEVQIKNSHINNICRKTSAKISALLRKDPYMDSPKRKHIMNTFFTV